MVAPHRVGPEARASHALAGHRTLVTCLVRQVSGCLAVSPPQHAPGFLSASAAARHPLNRKLTVNSLLYPMAAHVALAAILYAMLTAARAPAVWGIGQAADGANPWAQVERRISANLSNQFEWPLFFYAACLVLLQQGRADSVQVLLAWDLSLLLFFLLISPFWKNSIYPMPVLPLNLGSSSPSPAGMFAGPGSPAEAVQGIVGVCHSSQDPHLQILSQR